MRLNFTGIGLHLALFGLIWALVSLKAAAVVVCLVFILVHLARP